MEHLIASDKLDWTDKSYKASFAGWNRQLIPSQTAAFLLLLSILVTTHPFTKLYHAVLAIAYTLKFKLAGIRLYASQMFKKRTSQRCMI